jgi:hypothetical protein
MSKQQYLWKRRACLSLGLTAVLGGSVDLVALTASASAGAIPKCSALAGLALQDQDIKSATSAIVPATATDKAYCLVNLNVSSLSGASGGYLPGQRQNVNVAVGLPLSAADGGSGGMQGAWNGRIYALGVGGYAGVISPVTPATDLGYAGSSTDTGHTGGDLSWTLNPDKSFNWGLFKDYSYRSVHLQAVWNKKIVNLYYGMPPKYKYFAGCSGGGRQGHMEAQRYPDDFDGILSGSPAINADRVGNSWIWPQVVMNSELGHPISTPKLQAVQAAATQACDALDGVADGIVQDPRACHYDATQFVCKGLPSDPQNCLTSAEAAVVNKIWTGPYEGNPKNLLWFGLERPTLLSGLNIGGLEYDLAGPTPLFLALEWVQYTDYQNPSFDWHTITEAGFIPLFKAGEQKLHSVIGTDDPDLYAFKAKGGKLLAYHGLSDGIIYPRGEYNYYNRVTQSQGALRETQKFFRLFPFPGWGHCGLGSQSNIPVPNTNDLLNALVGWVEHGTPPDAIVSYNGATLAASTISRPVCKYPDTLVYIGGGGTNDASNFHCQVNKTDPLIETDNVLPDPGAKDHDHDHDHH